MTAGSPTTPPPGICWPRCSAPSPPTTPAPTTPTTATRTSIRLLAAGLAEPDAAKRAADYRRAEQIAIGQDLALIPLWYRTEYRAFDASKWVGVNNDFFENPTLRTIGLK